MRHLLGVSRQRVYQLATRSDFPQPIAELAQGKVWALVDIETWIGIYRGAGAKPEDVVPADGRHGIDLASRRQAATGRAAPPTGGGPVPLPPKLGDEVVAVARGLADMRDRQRW